MISVISIVLQVDFGAWDEKDNDLHSASGSASNAPGGLGEVLCLDVVLCL